MKAMSGNLGRLSMIKLVVFDVDGVFTDGRTWQDANGAWRRYFSVRDTMGIRALRKAGTRVAVVTTDSVFFGALDNQIPKFLDALTEYALSLKAAGTIKQPDFVVTPEMRAELFRRMRARGITVDEKTFEAARTLIDRQLGYLVARYVFGEPAEFARRLHDDPGVAAALKLTTGATTPQQLLQRASSR